MKTPAILLPVVYLIIAGCGPQGPSPWGTNPPTVPPDSATAQASAWVDARGEAIKLGDVTVRVTSAKVGTVKGSGIFGESSSDKKYFQMAVQLTNGSRTRKLEYTPWMSPQLVVAPRPKLYDDLGNQYRGVDFGFASRVEGQAQGLQAIYPEKSVSDVLVFEVPVDAAPLVRLELPAENVNGTGLFRFKIPRTMYSGQDRIGPE